MSYQGNPCWYELGTGDLDAAQAFYGAVLGWEIADAGMKDFAYLLARSGGEMVAGMMSLAEQEFAPPPNWLTPSRSAPPACPARSVSSKPPG